MNERDIDAIMYLILYVTGGPSIHDIKTYSKYNREHIDFTRHVKNVTSEVIELILN